MTLPSSLEELSFEGCFNQDHCLEGISLPSRVQKLTLGVDFNLNLNDVIWPGRLQNLKLESGLLVRPKLGRGGPAIQSSKAYFWFRVQPEHEGCNVAEQFARADLRRLFQPEPGGRGLALQSSNIDFWR